VKSTNFSENLLHLIFQLGLSVILVMFYLKNQLRILFLPICYESFKAQKCFVYHSKEEVLCVFSGSGSSSKLRFNFTFEIQVICL